MQVSFLLTQLAGPESNPFMTASNVTFSGTAWSQD